MGSKSGKFKYGYCIANGVAFEKNPSLAIQLSINQIVNMRIIIQLNIQNIKLKMQNQTRIV